MTQYLVIATRSLKDGKTRVKFGPDPSEEAARHRKVMMGHLVEQGHILEHVPACPEHGHHLVLHSGPLVQGD